MYNFPHSVTFGDIYRTLEDTEAGMFAFRKAAHYRYMNEWSDKLLNFDYITCQLPIRWQLPESRKYDKDAYVNELPESIVYEFVPDNIKFSGGYYINTLALLQAEIQIINSPGDYIPLAKSTAGELFVNANPRSPYYGIVVYVNKDYTYQAIVAHDAETFHEFWIESIVTAIDNGSVKDVCNAMQRNAPLWNLKKIKDIMISEEIVDRFTFTNILEQLSLESRSESAQIIVKDVGCYYSVGVISEGSVDCAGALFNKATGKCVNHGMGNSPDNHVLTWDKSFIGLMHIVRQEETGKNPALTNIRNHAFSDESIYGELDTYCSNFISPDMIQYTTPEQRRKRNIFAMCDGCGKGLCERTGIWATCFNCKNYDLCLSCFPAFQPIGCKDCHGCVEFIQQQIVDGIRIDIPFTI